MISIRKSYLYIVTAMLSVQSVRGGQNIFYQALAPARGLSLAQLYQGHSSLIDFALFLILFLGVSKAILAKRFEGRGGQAIVVAVGIILALSMTILQETLNTHLISVLGPISISLFLALIGVVFFYLLTSIKISKTTAACITYIILYSCFIGLAPELMQYMADKVPIIPGLLAIGLLVSMALLMRSLFSKAGKTLGKAISEPVRENLRRLQGEDKEEKNLKRVEKAGIKDTKKILHELNDLEHAMDDPVNQEHIASVFSKLTYDDNQLHVLLDKIKRVHKKLLNQDVQAFRLLERRYKGEVLADKRALLEAELQAELKKLKIEEQIQRLEKRAYELVIDFDDHVKLSYYHFKADQQDISKTAINKAKDIMKNIERLFKDIKQLDKAVQRLCKFQLKTELEQGKTVKQQAA